MAEQLDPRLENRLRTVLRDEADTAPVTLRAQELVRLAGERGRRRSDRRLSMLASAAVVAIAVGGAAFLALTRPNVPVAQSPGVTGDPVVSPDPSASAGPFVLATYADLEGLLVMDDPSRPIVMRGEHPDAEAPGATVSTEIGSVGAYDSLQFVISCTGGTVGFKVVSDNVDVFGVEVECSAETKTFGDGSSAPSADAANRIIVTASPEVRWRIVVSGAGPGIAPVTTLLGDVPEIPEVPGAVGSVTTQWAGDTTAVDTVPGFVDLEADNVAADRIEVAIACYGPGSVTLEVLEGGVTWGSVSHPCNKPTIRVVSSWVTPGAPAAVARVTPSDGRLAWRMRVSSFESDAAAPTLAPLMPGEAALVTIDLSAADGTVERTAEIPEVTDVYYVTGACSGTGSIDLEIDGVSARYECGALGLEVFTRSLDNQLLVSASVTGTARFVVRVGAVDLDANPAIQFRPPRLELTGQDRTAGDTVTAAGFPGCGLSWTTKAGGGAADSCGPSWQPIAAALAQRPGTIVRLSLTDGWVITAIEASIAPHAEILPSGRAPGEQPWTVRSEGDAPYVIDVPPAGDWGIRISVTAEKDGDTFGVPYYGRIIVEP